MRRRVASPYCGVFSPRRCLCVMSGYYELSSFGFKSNLVAVSGTGDVDSVKYLLLRGVDIEQLSR